MFTECTPLFSSHRQSHTRALFQNTHTHTAAHGDNRNGIPNEISPRQSCARATMRVLKLLARFLVGYTQFWVANVSSFNEQSF